MENDGFDDDFYKIFKKYKLDSMDELNLREEVQNYIKKRFVSKDKIRAKIKELEDKSDYWNCDEIEVLKELLEEE